MFEEFGFDGLELGDVVFFVGGGGGVLGGC